MLSVATSFFFAGMKRWEGSKPAMRADTISLQPVSPSSKPRPAAGTSLLARTWDFITDEAAYAEAVATQDPAMAAVAKQAPRPGTCIDFLFEGEFHESLQLFVQPLATLQ